MTMPPKRLGPEVMAQSRKGERAGQPCRGKRRRRFSRGAASHAASSGHLQGHPLEEEEKSLLTCTR